MSARFRAIRVNDRSHWRLGVDVRFSQEVALWSRRFAVCRGILQVLLLQHISPDLFGAFPSVYIALTGHARGPRMLYARWRARSSSPSSRIGSIDPIDARSPMALAIAVILSSSCGGVADVRAYIWRLRNRARSCARAEDFRLPRRSGALSRSTRRSLVALDEILCIVGPWWGLARRRSSISCPSPHADGPAPVGLARENITVCRLINRGARALRTFQPAISFPALSVARKYPIAHEHGAGRCKGSPGGDFSISLVSGGGSEIAGSMTFWHPSAAGLAWLCRRRRFLASRRAGRGLTPAKRAAAELILHARARRRVCLIDQI